MGKGENTSALINPIKGKLLPLVSIVDFEQLLELGWRHEHSSLKELIQAGLSVI